ncbi:MAG TPA: hypothetical protein VIJ46_07320 [Rhabdochlamydiaceae bacterium]
MASSRIFSLLLSSTIFTTLILHSGEKETEEATLWESEDGDKALFVTAKKADPLSQMKSEWDKQYPPKDSDKTKANAGTPSLGFSFKWGSDEK